MNNFPSDIVNVISEIIECNLEIGSINQAKYYIDILRNITGQEAQYKLYEYELRKDLILQLRQIMEFETILLLLQEDYLKKICKESSSSYGINDHLKESVITKQENEFPLSCSPNCTNSVIKKLNDNISQQEFFSDILPYIDQINNLQRSFNLIYNID
ncbi:unnamed protein product [Rotaria sp. Silwood2]|nr:unnamed protein product [Rotaria sp. Silwood2]